MIRLSPARIWPGLSYTCHIRWKIRDLQSALVVEFGLVEVLPHAVVEHCERVECQRAPRAVHLSTTSIRHHESGHSDMPFDGRGRPRDLPQLLNLLTTAICISHVQREHAAVEHGESVQRQRAPRAVHLPLGRYI